MASIDEMLFDALRRSNPIGRVIDDFKRAQPDLQAASTGTTGAAEALIGKLMVSPAFRTSATEEEARRRALEQDDLFVKALLGFEQAQGNPIQRAMAANESGAQGREIEQGVYNMFLDPTNLIPIPTGKVGKVANTVRQNEKLAQLMAGVTDAGNGDDLAALIEDAGKTLPLAPEKKDLAAYMKSLGLGKPEAVENIPSPLVPERTPNLLQLARDGNGVVETNRLNLPLDPSIGDLRAQLRNAQMPQVVGANDITAPSSLVPDKVPNLLRIAREAQGGKVPSLTAPVKGARAINARAGQIGLPESIPATELDKFLRVSESVVGDLPPEGASFWARNGIPNEQVPSLFEASRKVGEMGRSADALLPTNVDIPPVRMDGTIENTLVAIAYGKSSRALANARKNRSGEELLSRAAEIISLDPDKLAEAEKLIPGIGGQIDGLRTTISDSAPEELFKAIRKAVKDLDVDRANELVDLAPQYGVSSNQAQLALNSAASRGSLRAANLLPVAGRMAASGGGSTLGLATGDLVGSVLPADSEEQRQENRRRAQIAGGLIGGGLGALVGRGRGASGKFGIAEMDDLLMDDLLTLPLPGRQQDPARAVALAKFMDGAHPVLKNADGTPKVLYHGTTTGDFRQFAVPGERGFYGSGAYFTEDPVVAASYAAMRGGAGENIKPVYANLRNPYIWGTDSEIGRHLDADTLTKILKARGHDGVVVLEDYAGAPVGEIKEIVAFDPPKSVKSASGNLGTFDSNDPSLLRLTPNLKMPPLNGPVPRLAMKALTNQATAAPLVGGLAGGAAGATTGGITGALATPEDRWGGFKQGAAGGAVLGAGIGAGSFAYGLRHVTPETWSNLTKHSWELARKDVAETTANATGHSILPTPKQLISFWKNQTVSTMRQFGQDGTWNRMVTEGLQGKNATKLLGQITEQVSDRMALKGNDRLSIPVQDALARIGKPDHELQLGMPIVDSVAMHGLSRSQSVVSSALLSTFGPGNAIGGLVGAAKGAAMPEFSGMIRHANGALNRGFRETAFVDELDNKLIPLAVDAFKRLGYDLSAVPVDQLTRATVEQMYGPRVGAMWQKTMENMIPMAESRVRYLFGDYTPGQKGAIGIIEKITGPGMPFSSWAIRAYPVALDMAIQNPWVALGVYQFLQATAGQAGKDGRPRWTAGKVPISTEVPLLGAGARTLLGGQKGTAYVDPVGSLSPVGGDLFQPGADQEGPQSLYQQISEIIGRAGLPGLSPFLQGIAYMLGLDYKGPGNMSRTQGMENSLGLIPGNIDLPGWGDVALRAGRAKLSPAFAGTELGAKLGATGDKYPTVYDPVARRFGELVVKATGKSLDDPANRAYLYDLAAGTGELYDQARREVLLGGLARNAFSTTSPIGVATQGEDARQVRRDREGVPVPYELINAAREQGTPQQVAQLNRLNAEYKVTEPWAAAYDVGSKSEAESMLMEDALRRYTFRGVQYRPSSPAQLQRVVQAGKERAEGNRIPPKK